MKFILLLLLVSCVTQPKKIELKEVVVDGETYHMPPGSKLIIKMITQPAPAMTAPATVQVQHDSYIEPDWEEIDAEIQAEEQKTEEILDVEPPQDAQYEGVVWLEETKIKSLGSMK